MNKFVIAFALLIVSTQAFSFGSLINSVKNDVNSAVNHVQSAANNVYSQAQSAANHVVSQADQAVAQLNSDYKNALNAVNSLATQAASFASSVDHDITNEAASVMSQAEDLASQLHVAPECPEAILENLNLLKQIYDVSQDPTSIITSWNSMTTELYNICVGCSGKPQDFTWLKEIQLTQGDEEVAECGVSLVDFAMDAGELMDIADDVDPEIIISAIKAVEAIAQTCPSAINYIENNGLSFQ